MGCHTKVASSVTIYSRRTCIIRFLFRGPRSDCCWVEFFYNSSFNHFHPSLFMFPPIYLLKIQYFCVLCLWTFPPKYLKQIQCYNDHFLSDEGSIFCHLVFISNHCSFWSYWLPKKKQQENSPEITTRNINPSPVILYFLILVNSGAIKTLPWWLSLTLSELQNTACSALLSLVILQVCYRLFLSYSHHFYSSLAVLLEQPSLFFLQIYSQAHTQLSPLLSWWSFPFPQALVCGTGSAGPLLWEMDL